jgi:hypothetical protein
MFLQPLFFSDSRLAGLLQSRNIVIIVDASASMGYVEGGQTRFASACAEASDILRGLSSRDRADVIYLKSRAESIFPSLGENLGYLSSELRRAQVSNEPGNVQAALRKAADMFKKTEDGINEICIISDFQRSQWKDALPLKVPENIAVTFVQVVKGEASNQVISKVSSSPVLPLLGEDVTFNCEIRNYSPSPRRLTLYFQAGELHESSSLLIPAWGSATPQFQMSGKELGDGSSPKSSIPSPDGVPGVRKAGRFSYDFSIGEDDFPEDNERWGVLQVAESLKIGIVESTPYPATAWKRALKVFPWVDIKSVSLENLDLNEHYDYLLLSGWNGGYAEKIREMSADGTVIICSPEQGVEVRAFQGLEKRSFSKGAGGFLNTDIAAGKHLFRLKISALKDKIFAIFANGEYGDPVGGFLKKRLNLPQKMFRNQENIIIYSDGVPALVRCRTENHNQFYIWNIALDPRFSNFANRVQFVPLMAELILSSRFGVGDLAHLADYTPGKRLIKVVDFMGAVSDIALNNPKGKKVPLKIETERESAENKAASKGKILSLVSSPVSEIGIYSWNFLNEKVGNSVVNFAVSESDLRTMSKRELSIHGTSVASGSGSVNNIHKGVILWPYLLAFAVLIAITEGAVMFWSERGAS